MHLEEVPRLLEIVRELEPHVLRDGRRPHDEAAVGLVRVPVVRVESVHRRAEAPRRAARELGAEARVERAVGGVGAPVGVDVGLPRMGPVHPTSSIKK